MDKTKSKCPPEGVSYFSDIDNFQKTPLISEDVNNSQKMT